MKSSMPHSFCTNWIIHGAGGVVICSWPGKTATVPPELPSRPASASTAPNGHSRPSSAAAHPLPSSGGATPPPTPTGNRRSSALHAPHNRLKADLASLCERGVGTIVTMHARNRLDEAAVAKAGFKLDTEWSESIAWGAGVAAVRPAMDAGAEWDGTAGSPRGPLSRESSMTRLELTSRLPSLSSIGRSIGIASSIGRGITAYAAMPFMTPLSRTFRYLHLDLPEGSGGTCACGLPSLDNLVELLAFYSFACVESPLDETRTSMAVVCEDGCEAAVVGGGALLCFRGMAKDVEQAVRGVRSACPTALSSAAHVQSLQAWHNAWARNFSFVAGVGRAGDAEAAWASSVGTLTVPGSTPHAPVRVGGMIYPGSQAASLGDDLAFLASHGVGAIVSVVEEPLTQAQAAAHGFKLEIVDPVALLSGQPRLPYPPASAASTFAYLHLPTPIMGPPSQGSLRTFLALLAAQQVHPRDPARPNVLVHCLAGQGRTGTLLASSLMARHGLGAESAIAEIRRLRPASVESVAQEDALAELEAGLAAEKRRAMAARPVTGGGEPAAAGAAAPETAPHKGCSVQ